MNQSVQKAMQILDLFIEEAGELTLQEISDKTNIPKPTAYRLLSTLEAGDLLYKTKQSRHDSRYRLGLKLLELGQLVSDQLELRGIALHYMEQLARDINEVVHLVIVNQNKATYIEKVESTRALRLFTRIGKSTPLYIGSGPKLLLAHLPKEKQEEILAESTLFPLTNQTPIDKTKLWKELATIREVGYAFSIAEQDADTTGISYPIYDYRNQVIAALAVSGLSTYFEGERLDMIKEKTKETARKISKELGYREKG